MADSSRPSTRFRKPRVVHVTTGHQVDDVRIFEKECRSLVASGSYDVVLAAAGDLADPHGVDWVPLKDIPQGRARRFTSGPRRAAALTGALAADLWHFHDPELLPVAIKLARSGSLVVWDAHEDYVAQFEDGGAKSWVPAPARGLVRRGMGLMLKTVDRDAAGVVAATPTIAARYRNPRTVVVGNEARTDAFVECRPSFNSRRVLFTGSASEGHLFPEVVWAVAELPEVTLAVAGREPDRHIWEKSKSVLGDRLVHCGWLDRASLSSVMNTCALGLVTYPDLATNRENRPNKFFEFCAAGLPVVATPNPSSEDLIRSGAGGFVAPGFTSGAISRTIDDALSDEERWLRASTSARQWAADVGSWSRSEARLLALYESILQPPRNIG